MCLNYICISVMIFQFFSVEESNSHTFLGRINILFLSLKKRRINIFFPSLKKRNLNLIHNNTLDNYGLWTSVS